MGFKDKHFGEIFYKEEERVGKITNNRKEKRDD
jgi:hypothetical protein